MEFQKKDIFFADFTKLKQMYLAIKDSISPEEAEPIEKLLNELEEKIRETSNDFSEKTAIAQKIVELETTYLSKDRVNKILSAKTYNMISNQLVELDKTDASNIDKIEEFLKVLEEKWNSVKTKYSPIENSLLTTKLLKVSLKCELEKIK